MGCARFYMHLRVHVLAARGSYTPVPQGRAGFLVFFLYALEVLSRAQLLRVSICAYCT